MRWRGEGGMATTARTRRADSHSPGEHVSRSLLLQLHGGPPRPKTFFDLVDADGDGLISYAEYMFFNTLLASTSEGSCSRRRGGTTGRH